MTNRLRSYLLAAAASLGLGALGTPAGASVVTDETYYFTGTCSDCSGDVTATLVLTDYTPGPDSGFLLANLVSLTYGGSDLLPGFTVDNPESGVVFAVVIGGLANLPGANNVTIEWEINEQNASFQTGADGSWSVSYPTLADQGDNGSWSLTRGVPEPSTWAMMGLGVAGLAFAGYRARKRTAALA
jgi:hypothetical protein